MKTGFLCKSFICCLFLARQMSAQNVIDVGEELGTAPPVTVTMAGVDALLGRTLAREPLSGSPEARAVVSRLNLYVQELIDGWPWLPLHHTLGISGYEAYFGHPDELFLALAFSAPYLDPSTLNSAKTFGAAQMSLAPPYQEESWQIKAGNLREAYDVPSDLRQKPPTKARSTLGVYAFWAWQHFTGSVVPSQEHWPSVRERMRPLLVSDYQFDPARRDYSRDEAQKLNGDIAGLIGFVRLALQINDSDAAAQGSSRLKQLLELRLNLERINPQIIEKTTASKSLHVSKLARYCDLVPELALFLAEESQGLAAKRLKACRQLRSGWYLAYGDRFIGGENYTNPLHFPRALFAGAALIEQLPASELFKFIEVPWCKADFYFIEKCGFALWAETGRKLEPLH